jgi:hypothetical protein
MALRLPSNLSELVGDVDITSPADASLLQYDATSGKWVDIAGSTFAASADLTAHEADTANPHGVTAAQAGAVDLTGDTMTGGLTLGGDFTPGIDAKIKLRSYYDDSQIAYFQENALYPVSVGLAIHPHTLGSGADAVRLLDNAVLALGTDADASLHFDGTDLHIDAGQNPGGGNTIQLQPDFAGTGQAVEMFANAASGDRPVVRLWGYPDAYNSAWGESNAKYCDFSIDTWNHLTFDGTFDGVEFKGNLFMDWGGEIRLVPSGRGRIFATTDAPGTNRHVRLTGDDHDYGTYTFMPTWSFCHSDQRDYDFGYSFTDTPRLFIHGYGSNQTDYLSLYHDGVDGNIDVGSGDLQTNAHVDAAGFKVSGTAGASGTFTTVDSKTVTVTNGLITAIA